MTIKAIVLALFFTTATLFAEIKITEMNFTTVFGTHEGTIVVYDAQAEKYFIHNKERSEKKLTSFSTFKIPNSVIALETGVIKSIDTEFSWDTTRYPTEASWPEQWKATHTMRTAIRYSVVPFYREIATRVGKKRMQEYVRKFRYGNGDISSGLDNFWLNGSLAISAMQQIDFLRRFHNNKLGVTDSTIEAVKEILLQEKGDGYTLFAKTGGGNGINKDNPEKALGWYVGYVEKGRDVYFFALNIDGTNFTDIKDARIGITRTVLKQLKIIK